MPDEKPMADEGMSEERLQDIEAGMRGGRISLSDAEVMAKEIRRLRSEAGRCTRCGASVRCESCGLSTAVGSVPAQPTKKKRDSRYPLGHYNNPMPDNEPEKITFGNVILHSTDGEGYTSDPLPEAPAQPSQPDVEAARAAQDWLYLHHGTVAAEHLPEWTPERVGAYADSATTWWKSQYQNLITKCCKYGAEVERLQAQLAQMREALFDVYYSAERLIKQLQEHKDFHHPEETHLHAAVDRAKKAYSTAPASSWLAEQLRKAKSEARQEALAEVNRIFHGHDGTANLSRFLLAQYIPARAAELEAGGKPPTP